jgi:hypothetical protein
LKRFGKSEKKIERTVDQEKLRSYRRDLLWKFDVLVPHTHVHALDIDEKNGNTKWQDYEWTEMEQLEEYKIFVDKGVGGE